MPENVDFEKCVYHTFVIQTPERNALQKYLESQNIGCKIHYPIPIHMQAVAKRFGHVHGNFPVTERAAKEILSLPIHQNLEAKDVHLVIDAICKFFQHKDTSGN